MVLWVAAVMLFCDDVSVVSLVASVLIGVVVNICVLLVVEGLVVLVLSVVLVLADFTVLSNWSSVLVILTGLVVLWVSLGLVFDCLVVVSLVVTLAISVLEVLAFDVFVLGVAVVITVGALVSVANSLELVLRVAVRVSSLLSVFMVTDKRCIIFMDIDISVVRSNSVVDWSLVMDGDLVVGSLLVDNLGVVMNSLSVNVSWVLLRLVGCLGSVVGIDVMGILVVRLLRVDNLVVLWVSASVTIVVVHLEDKAAILNIDLAGHEEGGVVLESPVVTGVPFFRIESVEVISPFQVEFLLVLIVIIDLNEVVFSIPWHLSVVEIVVPW